MALKKSQIYSSLWASCDALRGGMDASQYKDYILVLLFVKYVSDRYAGKDDADIVVPVGSTFDDLVKLKGKPDIGELIDIAIQKLAEANELRGVIDQVSFNDEGKLGVGKAMVERLSALVGIFAGLDFRKNRAEGDDLLGDAYEYLMRNFSVQSGKSKGQFYTPAEVSRIIAAVIGVGQAHSGDQTIYDPTCGSGSLLLKAHDEARERTGHDLALYGQEKDVATYALARMNMILHGCATAEIAKGDTLSHPHYTASDTRLRTFDFVVSNPPFSSKEWSTGIDVGNDLFRRFPYGAPPPKNGDFAFLLQVLASMKSTGKGAIILPHGVLFRGNKEHDIRRALIRQGFIKGIIGLPPNLFYGTGIPACIIVLDKEHHEARKGIFMIDASKGIIKDGEKNRLRAQDIHRIVDTFNRQVEVPGYARMVSVTEISDARNDYNLNLPRYIDSSEPEDRHDIEAHLRGGIPDRDLDALAAWWVVFPSLRAHLFMSAGRPGYSQLAITAAELRATVQEHPEVATFREAVLTRFGAWRAAHLPALTGLKEGDRSRPLIERLSEDLLARFQGMPLIDAYGVYQQLMDLWAETMQDDVELITQLGWLDAARPHLLIDNKEQRTKEQPDYVIGRQRFKSDLIHVDLVVARYFKREQAALDALEAKLAELEQALDELIEEEGGDEGLLAEAKDDDRLTRKSVAARLKEIAREKDAKAEREVLEDCLKLIDEQGEVRQKRRTSEESLTAKVAAKYQALTEDEVKVLVAEDRWLGTLVASVIAETARISARLIERLDTLLGRYAIPLSDLEVLGSGSDRVMEHLKHVRQRLAAFAGDWKRLPVGKVAPLQRGFDLPSAQIRPGSTPIICSNGVVGFHAVAKAKGPGVVTGRSGTIGAVHFVETDYWPHNTALWVTSFNGNCAKYVYYMYTNLGLHRLATGSGVPTLNRNDVHQLEVNVPQYGEQQAIAAVLTDVDAEINALETRLAKTRAIKQAMMQELLSGRIPLP